jgi:hypothetical protein
LSGLAKIWKPTLLVIGLLVAFPYLVAPVYRFPAAVPFSGSTFLNPYAELTGTWQRANLHAHGSAWMGLTNGRQSSEAVVRRYKSLGYSVAGVSNYQQIAAFSGVPTLPLYEHGYSLSKTHQLAIGAREVQWFDFPLFQSLSHKQYVIDKIAATADLVALAHPDSREAYSRSDLTQLTGYHLIEIANGPHRSEEEWDAALSSGRAVWAIGNDDTHDLANRGRTAVSWTMIDAASVDTEDIVAALRKGRSYAVARTNEGASNVETVVADVAFDHGRLAVSVSGDPSTFVFIGQNGVIRDKVQDARHATYDFAEGDTYIRTVIHSPRTTMYLNPVSRSHGPERAVSRATVNGAATWSTRAGGAGAAGIILFLLDRRRHRAAGATSAALSGAGHEAA